MKVAVIMLSSLIAATFVYADMAGTSTQMKQKMMHEEKVETHTEMHNRFHDMKTDELLEMRGNMHDAKEREQLHNELMNRQHSMTKEQNEKFSRMPAKMSNQMGTQEKGMGYGQGQGMMQGKGKGMMQGQGGGKAR